MGHDVKCVDPAKGYNDDLTGVQAVFICIPVPTKDDRKQDLSSVEQIIEKHYDIPIFVRSTVLPGTCDYLSKEYGMQVIAMPEFLTHWRSQVDFDTHPIVTGPSNLPREIFFGKEIIQMSNTEAEMAKYAHNCFGATKIGYFNIIKELCDDLGINYGNVLRGASITKFIEPTHTQVPGPDGKYGYGGACLPKDLKAFIGFSSAWTEGGAKFLTQVEINNISHRAK